MLIYYILMSQDENETPRNLINEHISEDILYFSDTGNINFEGQNYDIPVNLANMPNFENSYSRSLQENSQDDKKRYFIKKSKIQKIKMKKKLKKKVIKKKIIKPIFNPKNQILLMIKNFPQIQNLINLQAMKVIIKIKIKIIFFLLLKIKIIIY